MLAAWVAFPLIVFGVTSGCGLLVRRFVPGLPGALLPLVGLAVIVVAGQFTTLADATAELTTPLVVALALTGYAVALSRGLPRPDPAAVACAAAVFAVYAAPIVLSGEATFAGYIRLDDTATWMAMTDRIMDHGRSLSGLQPSTYEATLAFNLGKGYPIGAFLPLGVARDLVGQDVAWVIQPYMASLGAMLALALWELPRRLVSSPALRGAVAFVAAQAALLYGYYLWGGIKEVTAAALVAAIAALAAILIERPRDARPIAALAIVSAAAIGVLSGGGAVWLLPPLGVAAVALVLALGGAATVKRGLAFAAAVAILCLPVILPGGLLPPTSSPIDSATALGNLIAPLPLREGAGIWPSGDFRLAPSAAAPADLLIVLALLAAAGALVWAWRARSWAPVVYVGGALVSALVIFAIGSPWVGGKALASASPAIPFAAVLAAAILWTRGRRVEGAALAIVLAGGVLWSNALAYRDVNLAPRGQLAELQRIGEEFAGEGPTLMTEYEPYGVRHFLRDADPEGASELRRRVDPLLDGRQLPKGESADTDRFQLGGLLAYRTLVLRRSPGQSRPPSPYRLAWRGGHYEVWQRPPAPPARLVEHLGLGTAVEPTGVPSCREVRRLAAEAGPGGRLAVVARRPNIVVPLSETGSMVARMRVPSPGRYEVWLGGSVRSEADLFVDGHAAGSIRHELNNSGEYVLLGRPRLRAGPHLLRIVVHGADLHPGSGGQPGPIGPLVLSSQDAAQTRVRYVPSGRAREICGRSWDWVEALRRPG